MQGFRPFIFFLAAFLVFAAPAVESAVNVTELPDGFDWLNTSQPVKLSQIKDHFVLLHFGIYSTPNADLTVKDLKTLSEKYGGELVVIGIHSAKFFDQTTLNAIRSSVAAQNVGYPVAVDANLAAWKAFHIYALPTVILIAPDGEVLLRKPGGEVLSFVDRVLSKRMAKYEKLLSHRLFVLGPVKSVAPAVVKEKDQVLGGEELMPAIDVTGHEPEIPMPQFMDLDREHFVGEKIRVNREYSRRVKSVKISLTLPPKTRLLSTVKSYVRVLAQDGEVIGGLETPEPTVVIPVDRDIPGDRLYIEGSFYYSQQGGLGLYKGLLFEVPLADYSKSENIELNYNVSNF